MRNKRVLSLAFLCLAVAGGCNAFDSNEHARNLYGNLLSDIRTGLMDELSMNVTALHGAAAARDKSETMIYVLGGRQESLENHFRMASDLYKKGVADRIYILSRPGITEYSPALSRNLTNDEWSIRELEKSGVSGKRIEPVVVPRHLFGTYSEAAWISRLAKARGYRRVVLVSSLHHARRVYLTFSHFLEGKAEILVYGSNDRVGLWALIVEYAKFVGYRTILFPLVRRFGEGVLAGRMEPRCMAC